nr:malonyl-CoA:anthocyanidin 5-O-glucoside-6''-O-malonyltransferase-like [Aegilops tauschii subsp. strangulata]
MNIRVRVLEATHVRPEMPGHTTVHQPAAVSLSLFDSLFLALPPIQRLFFYDGEDVPPFSELVGSLRSSLAATLATFTPLAGRIAAWPDGDLVIDCSPDALHPGVRFVVAEYSGDAADMCRLARDAEQDTEAFVQLVPELEVCMLPAPVLAVQVTRPAQARGDDEGAGAVAVGVSMHHAVADGQSLWQFMRAWAGASRAGSQSQAATGPPPTFDRRRSCGTPKQRRLRASSPASRRRICPELTRCRSLTGRSSAGGLTCSPDVVFRACARRPCYPNSSILLYDLCDTTNFLYEIFSFLFLSSKTYLEVQTFAAWQSFLTGI